jgi:polysaccharide biosynthesis protein PslH
VATAPLMVARGVQNKVLEAVAAGLPCVVTPAVAGGLPPEIAPACDVAESADQFAEALLRMLALGTADRGRRVGLAQPERLSWESRLAPIGDAVEEAGRRRVRRG